MNLTEPLYGAGTVKIGPFLSVQDAKTPMTNLNITRTNVRLSKNNGAFEPKANLNSCTHDKNGWYDVPLLSDDTDENGQLLVAVHVSGALPSFRKFEVYNGAAPEITVDPESQDLNVGDKLTLTVTATGDAPLHYQWKKDGDNIGTDSDTYEKLNAQESDSGDYECVVTNKFGEDTSATATIMCGVVPEITVDPESQDLNVGDTLTLTVTATGTSPLHYQWKQDGDNVGTDSDTYEKLNVQESDAGDYTCVVTNHFGSDESNAATVTVTANLSIFADYNLEHLND